MMAVPAVSDMVPRRGLGHLARPGSGSPLPGPSSRPAGEEPSCPRVRPQRIPWDGQVPSRIPGGRQDRNEIASFGLEFP